MKPSVRLRIWQGKEVESMSRIYQTRLQSTLFKAELVRAAENYKSRRARFCKELTSSCNIMNDMYIPCMKKNVAIDIVFISDAYKLFNYLFNNPITMYNYSSALFAQADIYKKHREVMWNKMNKIEVKLLAVLRKKRPTSQNEPSNSYIRNAVIDLVRVMLGVRDIYYGPNIGSISSFPPIEIYPMNTSPIYYDNHDYDDYYDDDDDDCISTYSSVTQWYEQHEP